MSFPPSQPPSPAFTLLRFTLVKRPDGAFSQTREAFGRFTDPEAAFVAAKHLAWQTLSLMAPVGASTTRAPTAPAATLRDTEWGYDLVRDGRIVERFWVHDHHSRECV
jgi:hypothetical protein